MATLGLRSTGSLALPSDLPKERLQRGDGGGGKPYGGGRPHGSMSVPS